MEDSEFESISDTAGQIEIVLNTTSDDPYEPIDDRLLLSIGRTGKKSKLHFKELESSNIQEFIDIMENVKEKLEQLESQEEEEEGVFDIDAIESGVSGSQRKRKKTVRSIIESETGEDEAIEVKKVIEKAVEEDIDEEKAEEVINRLKRDGELFEKAPGKIQLL